MPRYGELRIWLSYRTLQGTRLVTEPVESVSEAFSELRGAMGDSSLASFGVERFDGEDWDEWVGREDKTIEEIMEDEH